MKRGTACPGETITVVVAALTEEDARKMVANRTHGRSPNDHGHGDEGGDVWLDKELSRCDKMGTSIYGIDTWLCTEYYFA